MMCYGFAQGEPAHHHAPPPPCNRSSPSRSGLWGPELLHSLNGIRLPVSSAFSRASCPGYGCARSYGIHAFGHTAGIRSPRRVPQLDTWFMAERAMNTCGLVLGSRGSLISRRSCSAFAGWDSLANHSLGLITLGFAKAMTCRFE